MMSKAGILLAVGVVIFFISLTADAFGIGEGTGIGWKQISGSFIGLVVAATGIVQMRKKKGSSDAEADTDADAG
jgi:hypothetical protein